MSTAAVFMSGNSQAIRLPKEFRLRSSRVTIERHGDALVIREKPETMQAFLDKLPIIPDWPEPPEDGPEEPVTPW